MTEYCKYCAFAIPPLMINSLSWISEKLCITCYKRLKTRKIISEESTKCSNPRCSWWGHHFLDHPVRGKAVCYDCYSFFMLYRFERKTTKICEIDECRRLIYGIPFLHPKSFKHICRRCYKKCVQKEQISDKKRVSKTRRQNPVGGTPTLNGVYPQNCFYQRVSTEVFREEQYSPPPQLQSYQSIPFTSPYFPTTMPVLDYSNPF